MERNDRPHAPMAGRIWFGAPVAMVLATCVSTQTPAAEIVPATLQPSAGMSVMVRGGATQARKAIAHQAAYAIHAVDRIACSHRLEAGACEAACAVPVALDLSPSLYRQFDPSASNSQNSAP